MAIKLKVDDIIIGHSLAGCQSSGILLPLSKVRHYSMWDLHRADGASSA